MSLEEIIRQESGSIKVNWEKFHELYESARKANAGDFNAAFNKTLHDYEQVCAALMYYRLLHFNPRKDCLEKEENNYEIIGGYENENLNPKLLAISRSLILYFNEEADARAYLRAVLQTTTRDLHPLQIRKVEVIELETG